MANPSLSPSPNPNPNPSRYAALAAEGLAEEGDVHALQPVALRLGR